MQFIDLQTQYQRHQKMIDGAIAKVMLHGHYINGPEVTELEQRLAEFVGVKHCVGMGSGTDALLASLMALGIGLGDDVITTSFSFIATAEAIALTGARPIFIDIEPTTCNIDVTQIEANITANTKAIIAVDLYGQCADYASLEAIAKRHKLALIADAAQSMGAKQHGRNAGSFGDIACTSFYPAKPLSCYGEGGACLTNDDELAKLMRSIGNHGQEKRYQHVRLGFNARLDTIQAACVLAKLNFFSDEVVARQQIAREYTQLLAKYIQVPMIKPGNESVFAQYTIRHPQRNQLQYYLTEKQIPTTIHYPRPFHQQAVFAAQCQSLSLPVAEQVSRQVLSLPMHPYLQQQQISQVCNVIIEAVNASVKDVVYA